MQVKISTGECPMWKLPYTEENLRMHMSRLMPADKYANPYESYHSVIEVIEWFNKNEITYVGSYPHTDIGIFQSFLTQMKWFKRGNGFFIISGKEKLKDKWRFIGY